MNQIIESNFLEDNNLLPLYEIDRGQLSESVLNFCEGYSIIRVTFMQGKERRGKLSEIEFLLATHEYFSVFLSCH